MPSDIPDIPQSVDSAVRKPLSKLREAVQVLLGFRGPPEDAALTLRKMVTLGFARQVSGSTPGGAVGYEPVGGTGGGGGDTEPDLTPPPNVPDFTASPGLTQIFVEWPAATYTQGHGHKQTNIYAVKKAAGDATLPTFTQATRVFSATGALTVASLPSDLSTRWHIWLKYESNDGVESSASTGGTNGKVAQTGKIGNVDLGPLIVEAQNIASGAITPGKLSVQIGGGNLLRNSSFENCPDPSTPPPGWHMYASTSAARVAGRRGGYAMRVTFGGGAPTWGKGIGAVWGTNADWLPGRTYVLSFWCRASFGPGVYPMWPRFNVNPNIEAVANPLPTATWQRYVFRITWGSVVEPGGCFWISVDDYYSGGNVSGWAEFDDVQVEEGDVVTAYAPRPDEILPGTITQTEIADNSITTPKLVAGAVVTGSIAAGAVVADKLAADSVTAGKIAAGAIAVGSAAIANGAILNAMIADATIDNAKIASLSVSKLVAGSLGVGQHITSTNYVAGSSGWYIGANGFAEFSNITIRGATYTGTIYAGAGRVGNIIIDANGLRNEGFVSGSSGFYLRDDGYAEFNSGATFRGTLDVGGNSGQRTKHTNAGVQVFNSSNVEVIALGIF